jgi:hypothetical protein
VAHGPEQNPTASKIYLLAPAESQWMAVAQDNIPTPEIAATEISLPPATCDDINVNNMKKTNLFNA